MLKGHKESGRVILVERTRLLAPRRRVVLTITLDNGSEFAEHGKVAKAISAKTYFCDPYRSCQRGTNENTNGLIRQKVPRQRP